MATPRLLLGPVLRHVGETTATVWVQTDRPARVEVLGCTAWTFEVLGHHYALVEVRGLQPESCTRYEVHLDGQRVWPRVGSAWPASRIRTRGGSGVKRVVFGSCRRAKPDSPQLAASLGFDALDIYARRLPTVSEDEWPDALLLLGDQVYADDLTPQTRRWLSARRDLRQPPGAEVADFIEYARLYAESWSDEEVRWLLSTVSTAMIFDDHDVRDDWNTSWAWRERMGAQRWWHHRIRGALASYWVYQHLGNLPPDERAADPVWREVQETVGDTWPLLQRMAGGVDADPTLVRWSFRWDLDRVRLVMVDSRCGRILDEDHRMMLDEAEFAWVERAVEEDAADAVDHVLVGSSLPWLLPPAIHDAQSIDEEAANKDGLRGWLAEIVRQGADLEHWAAFRSSFDRLAALLQRVGTGPGAPATVSVLSGDVHHTYAARASFDEAADSAVHQLVCSPVHHPVPWVMKLAFWVGWQPPVARLARAAAHYSGVEDPSVRWKRVAGPIFGNTLATLVLDGRNATFAVERAVPANRSSRFERVCSLELTGVPIG
ncbi:MAG: alkaline phosphatase family protein [Actinomycetota bacterium]|nr:alkaline phosphatase family protein [Actinomycetota bacterium]